MSREREIRVDFDEADGYSPAPSGEGTVGEIGRTVSGHELRRTLVERAMRGSESAEREVAQWAYARIRPRVRGMLAKYAPGVAAGDPQSVDEMMQEILTTGVSGLREGKFQGRGLSGWLLKIAFNLVRRRAERREERTGEQIAAGLRDNGRGSSVFEDRRDPADAPDSPELDADELKERVREVLATKVGERDRGIARMFWMEGRAAEEVAAEIGVHRRTVYKSLNRARRVIVREMGPLVRRAAEEAPRD